MSNDTNAVQTPSKPSAAAPDELQLKRVGEGRFVATWHRNAYGLAPRKEA